MKTSSIITFYDLCSQRVKLFRQRLGRISRAWKLPFAHRVHDFYAGNRTARCPKRL